MCYAAPGPRCASSIRRQRDALKTQLSQIESDMDALRTQAASGGDMNASMSRMLDLGEQRMATMFALNHADTEFDETRTGQKILNDQISVLRNTGQESSDEARQLTERLESAKARRRVKMAAYRRRYPNGAPTVSHTVPAAAAAPAGSPSATSDAPVAFDPTEVKDEVTVDGRKFYRSTADVHPYEPYAIRIQVNREITDDEMRQIAGATGYAYNSNVRGEDIGTPKRDSPNSFVVSADTTKSVRSNVPQALDDFEADLTQIVHEGSRMRTTDREGPGTRNTQLVQPVDPDLKVEVYYDSAFSFDPTTRRAVTKG